MFTRVRNHPKTSWQKGTVIKEIKYHTKIQNKTKNFKLNLED